MSYRKYVVLDAVALFYFQMSKMPKILKDLQQKIINGEATAIIPTIAISEILWKLRKEGIKELESLKIAYLDWKKSPNIIIDSFDIEILDKMIESKESYELHDEIIAMTCYKYTSELDSDFRTERRAISGINNSSGRYLLEPPDCTSHNLDIKQRGAESSYEACKWAIAITDMC